MKVWVDMSAPAHVLVLRPIITRLRDAGHEVEVTSREYAQTQELLELHGIDHTPIGRHGGASRARKLIRLMQRTPMMRRFGKRRGFELALAHGSYDLAMAARSLGVPEANMHDYEFAVTQHRIACRLATRVIFPDSVPAERLRRFGVGPEKLRQYPGLKEEYYLADFEPDPGVLERLGVDTQRVVVVVRPPPDVSLYHRRSNPLFPQVLSRLGTRPRGPRRGPAAHGRPAKLPEGPRPALRDRRRGGGRGAEPGRARRSGGLGRGDDEPRGGGAGHPGRTRPSRAGSAGSTRR